MIKAKVRFFRLKQDCLDYHMEKSSDDHMVSKIFFDLTVGDDEYSGLVVEVSQPCGTEHDSTPIEVARPRQEVYSGPWSHNQFAEKAEEYYRYAMQRGMSFESGVNNTRIRDMEYHYEWPEFELEFSDSGGGW